MGKVWIGPEPDEVKRVRPKVKRMLESVPRSDRRAEVVCEGGAARRPIVVAVVCPRGVTLDRAQVVHLHGTCALGVDFTVHCPCGAAHTIDGGRLRSEVMASRPRSGRVPTIGVPDVVPLHRALD